MPAFSPKSAPEFEIFELPVAKGLMALSPLPGRGAAYVADLDHIRDWAPSLVISMTTLPEMQAEGAGGLGSDLKDMNIQWQHLPIQDFGAPTPQTNAAWPKVSDAALSALQAGGRVLVHCRGGCGRSGMVVLRLMIQMGEMPDAALNRLRALRPCAVETDAQMDWAMRQGKS